MKLKTHEITSYLPYKLQCQVKDMDNIIISELHSVYADGTCTFCNTIESEKGFEDIKPILKPLSLFYNDEIIKVKEYLGEKYDKHCDDYFFNLIIDKINIYELVLEVIPYNIFQYFLANHYDVFRLIDRGLAIIKKNNNEKAIEMAKYLVLKMYDVNRGYEYCYKSAIKAAEVVLETELKLRDKDFWNEVIQQIPSIPYPEQ